MQSFGVDVGGTGIKAGIVDLSTGSLVGDRYRLDTPQPAEPEPVGGAVREVVEHFAWTGAFGVAFPAVLKDSVAMTAANVAPSWIGTDVARTVRPERPEEVVTLNDADAAGLAEVRYGAAKDCTGVVLMLTFGTGIGSAVFIGGTLLPNTEFGHIVVDGEDGEHLASAGARERDDLSYPEWAKRVDRYLDVLEHYLWPDLIVVGGGVSKKADKWIPHLSTRTPVRPAQLRNTAGIVGAALFCAEARGADDRP